MDKPSPEKPPLWFSRKLKPKLPPTHYTDRYTEFKKHCEILGIQPTENSLRQLRDEDHGDDLGSLSLELKIIRSFIGDW